MAVAIRIYRHVGREFQGFGAEHDRSSSFSMPVASSVDRAMATQVLASHNRQRSAMQDVDLEKQGSDESLAPDERSTKALRSVRMTPPASLAPTSAPASRRGSVPTWTPAFSVPTEPGPRPRSSVPTSRRGSHMIAAGVAAEDFAPPPAPTETELSRHRGSIVTISSLTAPMLSSVLALDPIVEDKRKSGSVRPGDNDPSTPPGKPMVTKMVRNRQRAIQRQLRLLFIYPVVYIILWLTPFIMHCFNYNNYYAQNPIFALSLLNAFCQCFLGFADVSIFCWREKPWRHVPGSDGTFLGSFALWTIWGRQRRRRASGVGSESSQQEAEEGVSEGAVAGEQQGKVDVRPGFLGRVKRWSLTPSNSSSPRKHSGPPSDAETPRTEPLSSPRRPVVRAHRRTASGGSDRRQLEIDQAYERLALERADWEANRKSFGERKEGVLAAKEEEEERLGGVLSSASEDGGGDVAEGMGAGTMHVGKVV
ncbi:hypothetical protein LTR62_000950 [Meristemomyces frigidus]|uniref:G protein-coupled receptor GPR1/2/3 C-terminal domain-containing protein n=1 Tax=Meristemomyces frigidus TaxID=1508187 RepID=A0AAN7YLB0_9PEZI|nr:hypothetical protein LTR62_000950 [Meristemomyces frigidus]